MRNNEEELHFQFVKAFVIVLISLWTRFVCVFLELSQITSNVYLKLRTNSITMRFNFLFLSKNLLYFPIFPLKFASFQFKLPSRNNSRSTVLLRIGSNEFLKRIYDSRNVRPIPKPISASQKFPLYQFPS